VEAARQELGIDAELVSACVDQLWAAERVVVDSGKIALAALDKAEKTFVRRLLEVASHPRPLKGPHEPVLANFEEQQAIQLSPEQRAAVLSVTEHSVVVITGGPGVGKTTIVRAIVQVFERAKLRLRLAAPTGRAAKRLSETTRREACTLHRLLQFDPKHGKFQRNEDSPLEDDVVLVDEFSMVDIQLAAAVVSALRPGSRLVIVGDSDQLPSVGPGAVLRDLIGSRVVPVTRLETVYRQEQSSSIVRNAHRIKAGQLPQSSRIDESHADFFIVERNDAERAAEDVITLVTQRIPQRFSLQSQHDIQVLTPMHRGPAGTHALNLRLQAALNPEGPALIVRGQAFRVGDKVMQTHNDYDKEIYNGDIGHITELSEEGRQLVVDFDERSVAFEEDEMDSLVLAYATSIHKSQGSEYPAVVIPILTSHFVMLSRNLIYTAVTRAKRLCVLVADPRALRIALAEDRREERQTQVKERLQTAARE